MNDIQIKTKPEFLVAIIKELCNQNGYSLENTKVFKSTGYSDITIKLNIKGYDDRGEYIQ